MTEAEWLAGNLLENLLNGLRPQPTDRKLRLFACACCRRIWPMITDARSRAAITATEKYADRLITADELAAARAAAEDVSRVARDAARVAEDAARVAEDVAAKAAARAATRAAAEASRVAAAAARDAADAARAAAWTTNRVALAAGVASAAVRAAAREDPAWAHALFAAKDARDASRESAKDAARAAAEESIQSTLFRDIVGNPFQPVTVELPCHCGCGESNGRRIPGLTGCGDCGLPGWENGTVTALAKQAYTQRCTDGFMAEDRLKVLADAIEESGASGAETLLEHLRSPGPHARGCWALDFLIGQE